MDYLHCRNLRTFGVFSDVLHSSSADVWLWSCSWWCSQKMTYDVMTTWVNHITPSLFWTKVCTSVQNCNSVSYLVPTPLYTWYINLHFYYENNLFCLSFDLCHKAILLESLEFCHKAMLLESLTIILHTYQSDNMPKTREPVNTPAKYMDDIKLVTDDLEHTSSNFNKWWNVRKTLRSGY